MNEISMKNASKQLFSYSRLQLVVRAMFLFLFVFTIAMKAETGKAQTSLVSLTKKNTSIKSVLSEIEKQTEFLFIVNSNVDIEKNVSLDVKNVSVASVLDKLFDNTDVKYSVEGSHIILSKKESKKDIPDEGVTVSGIVSDITEEPLIGVSVVLKGTSIGTVTDIDGKFSFKLPGKGGDLVFTYIGYKPLTSPAVVGKEMHITMAEDTKVLNEVVVVAMGIERAATSLTYATQQIQGSELVRAKDANFINSLQGKSAGLVITPNASGAGGSSKVLLRGNQSVFGDNQPLIVIDGVPMPKRQTNQITNDLLAGGNGVDGGDDLSNINPDDIASMTILKGPNAAALYGRLAGSGAIVITTKKGSEGKVKIDVSSNITIERPLLLPEFQNDFGGTIGFYNDGSLNPNNPITRRRLSAQSWGPRIGSLSETTLNDIPYSTNSAQDNAKDFFRTGTTFNNSVAVSGGTKNSQSYFSYGHTQSDGIIPDNSFYRHNATFRQGVSFFEDRLKFDFSGSYVLQKTHNRPGSGQYANPLYSLYTMPRNSSVKYFKDHSEVYGDLYTVLDYDKLYKKTGTKGPIQQWPWLEGSEDSNNPYWYMNRLNKLQRRERFYASLGVTAKLLPELSVQARLKIDRTNDTNETKTYQGTKAKSIYNSIYEDGRYTYNQVFADALVTYNKNLGDDFQLTVNAGASTEKNDTKKLDVIFWMNDTTSTPNLFKFDNLKPGSLASRGPTIKKKKDLEWANAVFATALLGYKEKVFLDFTYRRDWHIFYTYLNDYYDFPDYYDYYSVGANAVLDQLLNIENEQLNFLKLRTSYSDMGNPIVRGLNDFLNNYSQGTVAQSKFRPWKRNPGSERVRSFEIGIDGLFFKRTVNASFTFYNKMLADQWLPQSAATGGEVPMNEGKVRNRGFETTLSYTFQPNVNFLWKTTFNYAYNHSEVLQTYEDDNQKAEVFSIFQGGLKVYQIKGRPYGEMYGRSFRYEADGKTIVTDRMGAPMKSTVDYDNYLGNANSPHHLGWSNYLDYKNFSFYFLIDGKIGGNVISYTEARMDMFGVSKRTGDTRNSGVYYMKNTNIGGESVVQSVPGIIMPDGNIAPAEEYYKAIGAGEPMLDNYVYSATNFRLREVSLGYQFKSLLGAGKDLSLSLVARNLFFIYKDSPVDPDVAVSTANGLEGIEAFALPTSRSIGLNVKLSF